MAEGKTKGPWYGWVVLAVVFLVMAVMIGARNSLGFFFKEICGEFGWTRAETAGAFSAGMLVQAACSPLCGIVGEKWSLRLMMAGGVLAGGAAFLLGASIGGLTHFYLMYALLNLGFTASTFVPQVQILANWFVRKRGLAMGVSNAGQGFAAVLTMVVPPLIAAVGWRQSYLVLAWFMILLVFPAALLLLRDRPEDRRTVADEPFLAGADLASSPGGQKGSPPGKLPARPEAFWRQVLAPPFLLLALIFATVASIMVGTTVHLVPHATDQGFTPAESALVFMLWGLCAMAGNLSSGLSDSLGRTATYVTGGIMAASACLIMAFFVQGMNPFLFYASAALSGGGLGLMRPTASAILADRFAGRGFGRINGSMLTVFALFGALAAFAMGHLFDLTGSYQSGFLGLAALSLAGAAGAAALGRQAQAKPQSP